MSNVYEDYKKWIEINKERINNVIYESLGTMNSNKGYSYHNLFFTENGKGIGQMIIINFHPDKLDHFTFNHQTFDDGKMQLCSPTFDYQINIPLQNNEEEFIETVFKYIEHFFNCKINKDNNI